MSMVLNHISQWFVSRSVADDSAMSFFEKKIEKTAFETPVGGFKKVASLSLPENGWDQASKIAKGANKVIPVM